MYAHSWGLLLITGSLNLVTARRIGVKCFYSENKGTYAHTTNGRSYLLDTTLEHLEQELSPKLFFRISRKYYININAIKDIISYTNSRLELKLNSYTEQEVIVARERVKDFKLWLE